MSRALLDEHRALWLRKPALAEVYGVWFELLAAELPRSARVLEVGAGPGLFAFWLRRARPDLRLVSADALVAPWNDLAADALRLPFVDACFDAVLALDVLHHLAQPAIFFREAARLLPAGGCVTVVEPWVSPFSYPIYRFLHQEGCTLGLDPWNPFGLHAGAPKDAFDGDAAVVRALVGQTTATQWRTLGFEPPVLRLLNGFAYVASLGFKPAAPVPLRVVRALRTLDRWFAPLSPALALRAAVTWRRAAQLDPAS
jgi:SAM-dependent methyltransferase